MKKLIVIGMLLALCGCMSQNQQAGVRTPSVSLSNKGNVSVIGDVSFTHPAEWGELTFDTLSGITDPLEEEFFFTGFYGTDGIGKNSQVDIQVHPYDEHEKRYEKICGPDPAGLSCDNIILSDMYEQKAELEEKATMTIAGFPTVYEEWYEVPSGSVARSYEFFTPEQRVRIYAFYSVSPFYDAEYWERIETEERLSTLDLIREDLGENVEEPYKNLVRIFPQESKQMQEFFAEVDAMIASIQ
jgi:hypothetical protein